MEETQISKKIKVNINDLFIISKQNKTYLKICAPMVRYSKLEFRTLVRKYNVNLCFTPMIMSDSFSRSEKARLIEFTTNNDDTPLIAQFAANCINDIITSAKMIYPYVDGVDLNCGCPQRWAINTGYGCALLNNPELIKDMVSTLRRQLPNDFSISVKIRLLQTSLSETIDLCRQIEKCGVNFITVHGRTAIQKPGDPSDFLSIGEIKKSLNIPVVANGDVRTLEDAEKIYNATNCDGVMSARGILANPTLFSGYEQTPIECIQNWLNITNYETINFQCFHHHLTFMMEKIMNKKLRIIFNSLTKKSDVYDFLQLNYNLLYDQNLPKFNQTFFNCNFNQYIKKNNDDQQQYNEIIVNQYNTENSKGAYFNEKLNSLISDDDDDGDNCSDNDFEFGNLFIENQ